MEKVRIDVSLCETLSVSHKAVGSHTHRRLLEVSLGGGGRIVDLVETGGFLLVYWSRGKW